MAKQFYLVSEATKITDVIQTRLKKDAYKRESEIKIEGKWSKSAYAAGQQMVRLQKEWRRKRNDVASREVLTVGDDKGMVHLEHPTDTRLAMHTQQVDTENW